MGISREIVSVKLNFFWSVFSIYNCCCYHLSVRRPIRLFVRRLHEFLYMVKRCERNRKGDRSLDPVHTHTFEKTTHSLFAV